MADMDDDNLVINCRVIDEVRISYAWQHSDISDIDGPAGVRELFEKFASSGKL